MKLLILAAAIALPILAPYAYAQDDYSSPAQAQEYYDSPPYWLPDINNGPQPSSLVVPSSRCHPKSSRRWKSASIGIDRPFVYDGTGEDLVRALNEHCNDEMQRYVANCTSNDPGDPEASITCPLRATIVARAVINGKVLSRQ
jgi:hypothetical protein